MKRIVMVCLGNICRSPLAEAILQSKLPKEKFSVDSAGTAAYHVGTSPDPRSIQIARAHGLDISHQRGRQFKIEDFDKFDHIFAMDSSNLQHIIGLARTNQDVEKVSLILESIYPGQHKDVPDPYYGGPEGFKNIYLLLNNACDEISKKLLI